jgi:hypothetical protein
MANSSGSAGEASGRRDVDACSYAMAAW